MRALLLFLFACTPADEPKETGEADADSDADGDTDTDADGDTDSDSGSDTGTDTGADTGNDTGGDSLPDVLAEMERNADDCQEMGGSPEVQGAKLYYWGEFNGSEATGWTGEERWYLFVNDAWAAEGGKDCVVSYSVTAESGSRGACGDCDIGMVVDASLSESETDCAVGVYRGYESMTETYGVALGGDGVATWHFTGSGDEFGSGYWADEGLNYLAEYGCTVRTD